MLSDVFCARLPRHISPQAFPRIHRAIACGDPAPGNLAGGKPG
jgi:hypothetical protein